MLLVLLLVAAQLAICNIATGAAAADGAGYAGSTAVARIRPPQLIGVAGPGLFWARGSSGSATDGRIIRVQQGAGTLPSPTIRPILISEDPAGDDNVVCYANPETYSNGYTDSPAAVPGKCTVEITDTVAIEFGGAKPGRVDVVRGPGGYYRQVRGDYYQQYFPPGAPLGEYDFTGESQGRPVTGGFTVKAASKRIAQLRFKDQDEHEIDYLALAGFSPGEKVGVNLYKQISYRPDVGTGERKWRFSRYLGSVAVDARGEAKVRIPSSLLDPAGNNLLVSEPMQQNGLNSARVLLQAQQ